MRFYLKLFIIVLAAVGMQKRMGRSESAQDWWFEMRCYAAQFTNDEAFVQRLVDEAYDARHVEETEVFYVAASGH